MRKHHFSIGEHYHIYNRGVDKRAIFNDNEDLARFLDSVTFFNTTEPIGSIYELSFKNRKERLGSPTSKSLKLVSIVAYCVNPNHFHLLVTPLVDKGIEKFMQRLGGYTKYFNEKHGRSGALFQGKFKSKHIQEDTYLLHVSAYINMNNRDLLGSPTSKLSLSSLEEYVKQISHGINLNICNPKIVLDQFSKKEDYWEFAQKSWETTQQIKAAEKELEFLPETAIYSDLKI